MQDTTEWLSTFMMWASTNVSASDPTAAGFYYIVGACDFIKCLYCWVGKGEWLFRDKPKDEYQRQYPHEDKEKGSKGEDVCARYETFTDSVCYN